MPFDGDHTGLWSEAIEQIVGNSARKLAVVGAHKACGFDGLRPADEAKQWYAACLEAGQDSIEGGSMRWCQHNGIGAFVDRTRKQGALLLDGIGLFGHIVRHAATQTLGEAIGTQPRPDVGGIAAVLGKNCQPVGLRGRSHLGCWD